MDATENDSTAKNSWDTNTDKELEHISQIVASIGFSLEANQPHISGERFLMTKDKLVLAGKRVKDDLKVIIKVSKHPKGKDEIIQEKNNKDFLDSLSFSNDIILLPKEIFFDTIKTYLIAITEFIPQKTVFVAHTIERQFFSILHAFEVQESFHATTFEHVKKIKKIFPVYDSNKYIKDFKSFIKVVEKNPDNKKITKNLKRSLAYLEKNTATIDLYSNHLTHSDFVPHNFRIKEHSIYMLDCSAINFGNKYEGWARFLNYMVIHNPELENLLSDYVLKNRGKKEYLDLKLMRIYKLGFLLKYYAEALEKTSDDLHELTLRRLNFWSEILDAVLDNRKVNKKIINSYIEKRDTLRSDEEKKRQKEFAIS